MLDIQRVRKVCKWLVYNDYADNDKELAEFIGYTKSSFSQILNEKVPLSAKFIDKLCDVDENINKIWVFTGKGKMLKSEEKDPLSIKTVEDKGFPLVSVTAIGGFGGNSFAILPQDVKEYYKIPKFANKRIDFMIEVEGSSMYPKYSSGDIVACTIIKESRFIQWNKTHVIATQEQGIIIKRIKESHTDNNLIMVSDNVNYDPFEVPKDEITGIALVVGVIRLE